MILTGFLAAFLVSCTWAADQSTADEEIPFVVSSQGRSDEEIPFVVASQGNPEESKVSSLLPELEDPQVPPLTGEQSPYNRGRSDIEIEDDQPPSGGYFYPKPATPFNLPQFKTLEASAPLDRAAYFAEENPEIERLPRSPRRRPPYFPSPPPFIPGFIPPNQIRPLPALYGRPMGY